MAETENRKKSNGERVGRGAQHPTDSTQEISLRISISLLWFETYFVATHYKRMAAKPRGQQPGMATLRPSVGERPHDGARGALSEKVGAQDRKRRPRLRGHRKASLPI